MTKFIMVHNVYNKPVYINVDEISHFLEYHPNNPDFDNGEVLTNTCMYFKHSDRRFVVETVDELLHKINA